MSAKVILIVDDSETMRQLTRFALRQIPDLRCLEAGDGARALEILKTAKIDLILLDINMPVMTGFGFLEELSRREEPAPPVIVMTTEDSEEDVARAGELGVVGYVTKPLRSAIVAETVKAALEGRPLK